MFMPNVHEALAAGFNFRLLRVSQERLHSAFSRLEGSGAGRLVGIVREAQ